MEGAPGVTLTQFLLQLLINLLVSSLPTAAAIYFGMRLAIKHQFKVEKRRRDDGRRTVSASRSEQPR
jgi:hypothetical protein